MKTTVDMVVIQNDPLLIRWRINMGAYIASGNACLND